MRKRLLLSQIFTPNTFKLEGSTDRFMKIGCGKVANVVNLDSGNAFMMDDTEVIVTEMKFYVVYDESDNELFKATDGAYVEGYDEDCT